MLDQLEKTLIEYVTSGGNDPKKLKMLLMAAFDIGRTEGIFSERRWNNWDGITDGTHVED